MPVVVFVVLKVLFVRKCDIVWSRCGSGRERGGEGSGEQCQVSDRQSWQLFTNHSIPLNPVRGEMQGRAARRRCGQADTQDDEAAAS